MATKRNSKSATGGSLPKVSVDRTKIPKNWTFKDSSVASNFDVHVREQLPWYDMATSLVAHVGRHYLPEGGRMYDLGASTGNITTALKDTLMTRGVEAISVDSSPQMQKEWRGYGVFELGDVTSYTFKPYDFCVCFLLLMFLSPEKQREVFTSLHKNLKPGGALLVFDKVETSNGYLGTVLHRLTIMGKVDSGVPSEDIIHKELSLSGVQRPLNPRFMDMFAGCYHEVVFRYGEFIGWVLTR